MFFKVNKVNRRLVLTLSVLLMPFQSMMAPAKTTTATRTTHQTTGQAQASSSSGHGSQTAPGRKVTSCPLTEAEQISEKEQQLKNAATNEQRTKIAQELEDLKAQKRRRNLLSSETTKKNTSDSGQSLTKGIGILADPRQEKLKEQARELGAQIDAQDARIADLKTQVENQENMLATDTKAVMEIQEKINDLNEQINDKVADQIKAQSDLRKAEAAVRDIQAQRESTQEDRDRAVNELKKATDAAQKAEQSVAGQKSKIADLEKSKAKAAEKVDQANKDYQASKVAREQTEKELKDLEKQKETLDQKQAEIDKIADYDNVAIPEATVENNLDTEIETGGGDDGEYDGPGDYVPALITPPERVVVNPEDLPKAPIFTEVNPQLILDDSKIEHENIDFADANTVAGTNPFTEPAPTIGNIEFPEFTITDPNIQAIPHPTSYTRKTQTTQKDFTLAPPKFAEPEFTFTQKAPEIILCDQVDAVRKYAKAVAEYQSIQKELESFDAILNIKDITIERRINPLNPNTLDANKTLEQTSTIFDHAEFGVQKERSMLNNTITKLEYLTNIKNWPNIINKMLRIPAEGTRIIIEKPNCANIILNCPIVHQDMEMAKKKDIAAHIKSLIDQVNNLQMFKVDKKGEYIKKESVFIVRRQYFKKIIGYAVATISRIDKHKILASHISAQEKFFDEDKKEIFDQIDVLHKQGQTKAIIKLIVSIIKTAETAETSKIEAKFSAAEFMKNKENTQTLNDLQQKAEEKKRELVGLGVKISTINNAFTAVFNKIDSIWSEIEESKSKTERLKQVTSLDSIEGANLKAYAKDYGVIGKARTLNNSESVPTNQELLDTPEEYIIGLAQQGTVIRTERECLTLLEAINKNHTQARDLATPTDPSSPGFTRAITKIEKLKKDSKKIMESLAMLMKTEKEKGEEANYNPIFELMNKVNEWVINQITAINDYRTKLESASATFEKFKKEYFLAQQAHLKEERSNGHAQLDKDFALGFNVISNARFNALKTTQAEEALKQRVSHQDVFESKYDKMMEDAKAKQAKFVEDVRIYNERLHAHDQAQNANQALIDSNKKSIEHLVTEYKNFTNALFSQIFSPALEEQDLKIENRFEEYIKQVTENPEIPKEWYSQENINAAKIELAQAVNLFENQLNDLWSQAENCTKANFDENFKEELKKKIKNNFDRINLRLQDHYKRVNKFLEEVAQYNKNKDEYDKLVENHEEAKKNLAKRAEDMNKAIIVENLARHEDKDRLNLEQEQEDFRNMLEQRKKHDIKRMEFKQNVNSERTNISKTEDEEYKALHTKMASILQYENAQQDKARAEKADMQAKLNAKKATHEKELADKEEKLKSQEEDEDAKLQAHKTAEKELADLDRNIEVANAHLDTLETQSVEAASKANLAQAKVKDCETVLAELKEKLGKAQKNQREAEYAAEDILLEIESLELQINNQEATKVEFQELELESAEELKKLSSDLEKTRAEQARLVREHDAVANEFNRNR